MKTSNTEPLDTPREVAARLKKPEKTLAEWRSKHIGPPYLKMENGSIRYERSAVDAWLASCRITRTEDAAASSAR